eukprot:SAG31_NODE_4687_length_3031_cov_1.632674_4_plen_71_part_00
MQKTILEYLDTLTVAGGLVPALVGQFDGPSNPWERVATYDGTSAHEDDLAALGGGQPESRHARRQREAKL